ncbi:serine/threonine-protein kinase [Kitasatospora cathayae]|uniref:non-specific serine/threonine protein kinase n=1 Tax=Kitasatospora cathayae TaxID=3004092 RepID=A0ABY7Q6Y6_9ACTN|nr:serine/threonine-protein kinase [Kitasatospora sp. HUAS 3-15]WBP88450.1 protein kinase [Kitasatospora sp. HUAS 3-15]
MGVQDRPEAAEAERLLAGRYELGERLGRGGMGTVWRAWDRMLDREVAVKELTVNHLPEEDLQILHTRMKREASAAARIKHPGVITVHDVLEQDGRPWIVMELVDGRSLADVISQDGTLPPRAAAEVGSQVLAALHRGHQLGVLHRDVKPANVLLERGTGRVVLLDFGIAKYEGSTELTRPGDLVGSPDYLAPERAQGERPGPASDLWGLGATLYAAVEGQSPFRRDSPITTLAAVVDEPLPESRRAGPLGPVLAALMAKDPADRPSADEAARMLAEVQAGHTMGLTTVGPSAAPVRVPTQSVPLVDRSGGPEGAAEPVSKGSEDPTDPRPATAVTAVAGTVPPAVQHPAGGVPAAAQAHTAVGAPVAYSAAPARGPAGRRNRMKLVAIVLAVGVLAAGATFFVTRHLAGSPAADPTPTAQPDTTEPTDELATGTPTPGAPAPAGYRWVDDPAGFRFPLPTGNPAWQRILGTDNNQIFYSPDNKVHYLQFAVTVGQSVKPLDHMREMEVSVSKSLKDYKQHRMASTAVNGHEAAVWEFSYAAKEGGRRRAIETEFIDEDGTAYAIYSSSPDKGNDWTEAFQRFTTVLNGFTPTR